MKKVYALAAICCVLMAAAFLLTGLPKGEEIPVKEPEAQMTEQKQESVSTVQPTEAPVQQESTEQYQSPIDFAALQQVNPEQYAWLEISAAGISEPILQSAEDDSFYLTHGSDGQEKRAGALFTEHRYNSKDFNDPVTIIYGHMMSSGEMFGNLQQFYSDPENFRNHREITVYLPDEQKTYEVFAATIYDDRHILDNYDFNRPRIFSAFFESIYEIRGLSTNLDKDYVLEYDSKILVLSTCLQGDFSQRYLVFAKEIME